MVGIISPLHSLTLQTGGFERNGLITATKTILGSVGCQLTGHESVTLVILPNSSQ